MGQAKPTGAKDLDDDRPRRTIRRRQGPGLVHQIGKLYPAAPTPWILCAGCNHERVVVEEFCIHIVLGHRPEDSRNHHFDLALFQRPIDNRCFGNAGSFDPNFSPNGNRVAFYSNATNLLGADANGNMADIYIKNLTTDAVTRISTNAAGVQGNGFSFLPRWLPDSTGIVFVSSATNLLTGADANGTTNDIFLKDLGDGSVDLISCDSAGVQANDFSTNPVVSPDGKWVAFESFATNLAAGADAPSTFDIFVKNLATGATKRVTTATDGSGDGGQASFSSDGKFLYFASGANDLVAGDTNGFIDIFRFDLATSAITGVSAGSPVGDVTTNANTRVFNGRGRPPRAAVQSGKPE